MDAVVDTVGDVLNALGAAWVTHQLYPNPTEQVPFLRAVDLVAAHVGSLPPIAVGAGVFLVEGMEIESRREGTDKLARRLFIHDVELIEFVGEPSPSGLAAFFEVIARDDEEVEKAGGIAASLVGTSGVGIRIKQRGLLNLVAGGDVPVVFDEEGDRQEDDSLPTLARIALHGAEPAEIAAAVEAEAEAEADPAAAFVDSLHELGDHVDRVVSEPSLLRSGFRIPPEDPYRTVRTFIESFFHLPRQLQVEVLERVLEDLDRADNTMFLDQFSGNDLMGFLEELTGPARDRLLVYAVEASSEPSGRPLDLLAGLSSAVEVEAARKSVVDRVAAVLTEAREGELEDEVRAVRAEMEAPIDAGEFEVATLRGLLECEEREERFRRAARVWTGRIARHVRDGDLRAAAVLLAAVLEDPPYPADRHGDVRRALERMTTSDFLFRVAAVEDPEGVRRLLDLLGPTAVEEIVDRLAEEDQAPRRRILVELLAIAARERPAELVPYLSDDRWYIVRNLVTALGATGNPDAVAGLRLVADHTDHRVRMECLRASVRLQRDGAFPLVVRAFSDPHEQVRHTALALVRGLGTPDTDGVLASRLRSDGLPLDVALEIVDILGASPSAVARQALEEIAHRRFAFRSRTRTLRAAARLALQEER